MLFYLIVEKALTNVACHAGGHRVIPNLALLNGEVLSVNAEGLRATRVPAADPGLLGIEECAAASDENLVGDSASRTGLRRASQVPRGATA